MKIINLIFDVEIVKVDTFLLGRISKESWIFFFTLNSINFYTLTRKICLSRSLKETRSWVFFENRNFSVLKIINLIFDVEMKVNTFLLGRISKESWIFFFFQEFLFYSIMELFPIFRNRFATRSFFIE